MSKKNEKEDVEDKPKKTSAKKNNGEKMVLSDLVLNSDVKYTKIILELSRAGLLKQYYEELELKQFTDELEPTITIDEFDKIIDGR